MFDVSMKNLMVSLVATIVVALLAGPAAADTVTVGSVLITKDATTSAAPFVPSATDLGNAGQPSLVGMSVAPSTSNPSILNDGVMGPDANSSVTNVADRSITFTLADPAGYDIFEIASYAGWSGHISQGRQMYNAFYSVVGDPNFLPLLDVTFVVPPDGSPHPSWAQGDYTRVALTSVDAGQPLATQVDAIRLDFGPVTTTKADGTPWMSGNNRFHREIDVIGEVSQDATAIPEPATLVMLGLGGLVALRRRRRRA